MELITKYGTLAQDGFIPKNFSSSNISGKRECRKALLKKCGIKDDGRPVIVFVGRLTEQKGIDIMLDALEKFLPEDIFAVIVGSGNELYNRKLIEFAADYPDSVHAFTGFSDEMAHLAYARRGYTYNALSFRTMRFVPSS